MKFRVFVKNPDALTMCLRDALDDGSEGYPDEEKYQEIKQQCQKWFQYDECVELEIDTDADTCIVIPHQ